MATLQQSQVAQLLGTTDIFSKLETSHLEAIANVCKIVRFEENSTIVKQGDSGDELFIIASGRVAVVHEEKGIGSEQLVTTLENKQCFGETSLLAEAPRSATIKALEETACVVLTKRSFDSILKQIPEVTLEVSRFLAARLHHQCQLTGFRFVSPDEMSYDPDVYNMLDEAHLLRHRAVPLSLKEQTLTVALTNPNQPEVVEELRKQVPRLAIEVVVCSRQDYETFLRRHRPKRDTETPILQAGDSSAEFCLPNGEALKAPLSDLLREALNQKVSQLIVQGADIYSSQGLQLDDFRQLPNESDQFRLNQQLQKAFFQSPSRPEISTTVVTFEPNSCQIQASRVETINGPRIGLRILNSETDLPGLRELFNSAKVRDQIKTSLTDPGRIVLLAGPARTQKARTGHIVLNALRQEQGLLHTISLEDSIEAIIRDIPQVNTGRDWAESLSAALSQNPTALFLHERKPQEFAEIFRHLTGSTSCLVSLRSTDPLEDISNLLKEKAIDESALESLDLVIRQRVIPSLSPHSKEVHQPSESILRKLSSYGIEVEGDVYFDPGHGKNRGPEQKIAVVECLLVNSMVREMLLGGRGGPAIRKTALGAGLLTTFSDSAAKLYAQGEISTSSLLKFLSGLKP